MEPVEALLFIPEPLEETRLEAFRNTLPGRKISRWVQTVNGSFSEAVRATERPDGSRSPAVITLPAAIDTGARSLEALLKLLDQLTEKQLDLVSLTEPDFDTRIQPGPREYLRFDVGFRKAVISRAMKERADEINSGVRQDQRMGRLPPCWGSKYGGSGCGHSVMPAGSKTTKPYHISGLPRTISNPHGVGPCGCGCREYQLTPKGARPERRKGPSD